MTRLHVLFVLICLAAIALVVGYAWGTRRADPGGAAALPEIDDPARLASVQSRPHIVYVNKQRGSGFGRVAVSPLDALDGPRYLTPLACERVYFAAGSGACLTVESTVVGSYYAYLFNDRFEAVHRIPLQGYPSRTRVSPDGRTAAFTVFVRGDSYASGNLSTRTTLVETDSGKKIADLEEFDAIRDGGRFRQVDFNYWGVTFLHAPDLFYATLQSGGRPWLVQGHIGQREVRVLNEGVECPSLSPDDRRIVFKSRDVAAARPSWRLKVLSLDSRAEVILGETRSVDDQATWLDPDRVLYALLDEDSNAAAAGVTNLWSVAVDSGATPTLILKGAYSPAVVAGPSQDDGVQ